MVSLVSNSIFCSFPHSEKDSKQILKKCEHFLKNTHLICWTQVETKTKTMGQGESTVICHSLICDLICNLPFPYIFIPRETSAQRQTRGSTLADPEPARSSPAWRITCGQKQGGGWWKGAAGGLLCAMTHARTELACAGIYRPST